LRPEVSTSEKHATRPWEKWDWAAASLLFFATATVVLWQNFHVGVLWDLSYILENAQRIALGDHPYRDFPLPYAPLTFLVQAAIIKLSGRVFFHHVAYAACTGGIATVLTWRILLHILRHQVQTPRLIAFVLSLPLTVLGIYGIFPHPFYDADCTFVILLCILLLQRLEDAELRAWPCFLAGVVFVVPLFVKQNTGLAFLASTGLALVALTVIDSWHGRPIRGYVSLLAGMACGLAVTASLLQVTVGLQNYWHWTIQFAASRRTPTPGAMFEAYASPVVWCWVAGFAIGAACLRIDVSRSRLLRRVIRVVSVVMMSSLFIWPVIYLFMDSDSSERAERLLALWPIILILSLGIAVLSIRRKTGISLVIPWIVIATIQGAFLSQQVWGSTYAIWPLLMILLATVISYLSSERHVFENRALTAVIAMTVLVSGGFYAASHERLSYADVFDGDLARSGLPALQGLSVRGAWIAQFEELVHFSEREIPAQDGLLMMPGEDLFYFTTGRRPHFPALMFDHTVNPYTAEQIVELSGEKNIRWLVIKRNLQLGDQPFADQNRVLEQLRPDFEKFASLDNYDVYRHK
jgi:hypothetical protein